MKIHENTWKSMKTYGNTHFTNICLQILYRQEKEVRKNRAHCPTYLDEILRTIIHICVEMKLKCFKGKQVKQKTQKLIAPQTQANHPSPFAIHVPSGDVF